MRRRINTTRNTGRKLRRLTVSIVIAATVILAIGAITVLSRQNAETRMKSQIADKANLVNSKLAAEDVHVTNETQERGLTPEEAQQLATELKELVNQSTEGLVQVKHADGSVSVDLEGRFQNVTVARINKDGSVTQSCVDNPKAAGAFFGIDPKLIDNKSEGGSAKPAGSNSAKTAN